MSHPAIIGAKGNEGVSNNVSQTKGSIGYVEYAYAQQNKMTYTKMVNKDGETAAEAGRCGLGFKISPASGCRWERPIFFGPKPM